MNFHKFADSIKRVGKRTKSSTSLEGATGTRVSKPQADAGTSGFDAEGPDRVPADTGMRDQTPPTAQDVVNIKPAQQGTQLADLAAGTAGGVQPKSHVQEVHFQESAAMDAEASQSVLVKTVVPQVTASSLRAEQPTHAHRQQERAAAVAAGAMQMDLPPTSMQEQAAMNQLTGLSSAKEEPQSAAAATPATPVLPMQVQPDSMGPGETQTEAGSAVGIAASAGSWSQSPLLHAADAKADEEMAASAQHAQEVVEQAGGEQLLLEVPPEQLQAVVQSLLESIKNPVLYSVGAYSDPRDYETLPGIAKCKQLQVKTPTGFAKENAYVCLLEPVPQSAQDPLHMAFVFRGTEPYEVKDIAVDLAYTTTDIGWFPGRAHGGFLSAFNDSITDTPNSPGCLTSYVEEMLREEKGGCLDAHGKPRTPDRVLCAGHSLGGALATLAAAWAKHVKYKDAYVRCITIGSPRVGDQTFADAFNALINAQEPFGALELGRLHTDGLYRLKVLAALEDGRTSMRIVHSLDVVPSLPFADWEFAHVANPVWLQRVVNNWGMDMVVWAGQDRPPYTTGWLIDHFEWRYRAARDIAFVTPILGEASTPAGPVVPPAWWRSAMLAVFRVAQLTSEALLWVMSGLPDRYRFLAIVWLLLTFITLPAALVGAAALWAASLALLAFAFAFPVVALLSPALAWLGIDLLSRGIKALTYLAAELGL